MSIAKLRPSLLSICNALGVLPPDALKTKKPLTKKPSTTELTEGTEEIRRGFANNHTNEEIASPSVSIRVIGGYLLFPPFSVPSVCSVVNSVVALM